MRPAAPAAAAASLQTCDSSPSDVAPEHGEQHELRQEAAAHPPGEHVARAEPQDDDDAAEGERDGDRDQNAPVTAAASRAAS